MIYYVLSANKANYCNEFNKQSELSVIMCKSNPIPIIRNGLKNKAKK